MNEIRLEFNKSITKLAGYDHGKDTYIKQIKNHIDYSTINILVFPENINQLASSFVEGLFEEIIEKIGLSNVEKIFQIKSDGGNINAGIEQMLGY